MSSEATVETHDETIRIIIPRDERQLAAALRYVMEHFMGTHSLLDIWEQEVCEPLVESLHGALPEYDHGAEEEGS